MKNNSTSSPTKIVLLAGLCIFLHACAGSGVADDPDLFTEADDIPERPGIVETLGDKKLEIEF